MADDQKRHSEVVREHGERQAIRAMKTSDEWKAWAEQFDDMIRAMPEFSPPSTYDEDRDLVPVTMGAPHISVVAMREVLYRVLGDADAVTAALIRAAVLAETQSDDLADHEALDECETCGQPSLLCSWARNPEAGPGDCCSACTHAVEGGESRG